MLQVHVKKKIALLCGIHGIVQRQRLATLQQSPVERTKTLNEGNEIQLVRGCSSSATEFTSFQTLKIRLFLLSRRRAKRRKEENRNAKRGKKQITYLGRKVRAAQSTEEEMKESFSDSRIWMSEKASTQPATITDHSSSSWRKNRWIKS